MPSRPVPRGRAGTTYARAIYDYAAAEPDQIGFSEGEMLVVTAESDDGWWTGSRRDSPGEVGLFPGSYVEVVEAPAAPSKAAKPVPAPKPRGLGGPSALVNPAYEGAMPETVEMVSFPRLVKPSRPPLAGKPAKFDPDHTDRPGFSGGVTVQVTEATKKEKSMPRELYDRWLGIDFKKRCLIGGGIAFVLILIIALGVGLSGGGDDAEPVPTGPTAAEAASAARSDYFDKMAECDALTVPAEIYICNRELDELYHAMVAAEAALPVPANVERRPAVVLVLQSDVDCTADAASTTDVCAGAGGGRLARARARRDLSINDTLAGLNREYIQALILDNVINSTGLSRAEIDQILVSGTAVTDAIEATVVLNDWVSKIKAESAALNLNSIVSNGTLASFVSADGAALGVLQVLENEYDLPINATRIQELAALAAESAAVLTVAEAAQKVFAFDTYGWLASNVLPHLPVPPTFNTSQGAEGMNIQASLVRSEPDITIITVVGEVDVDQDCGLADGLCNLVAATLGDATAAEMNLRMHKGPGVEVGLAANIEVSGIRLARYDEPQGSDTYPCGDGSQAARAVLARAEIYADITSTLGGPLVLGSFPRVSAGVRAEIDVEMQKRNGECGGPAILSPLHLRGHLGVGQVASPFGRREARDVTADRAADGTADVAAVHDRHERQSTITVITGSTYALGVLYEPFELTSVALSDLMFDTDIIPATLTVSRLEGTGTLSLGQQCYIREAVTRRVIAVKNGTDPTNGCIEGVAVFGVGIGLGSSSGSGGYFVATIPNGPTIGKLVNAFAPERVTSILDRFPRIITESGFNGVLEITFAAQAMTLGEVGSYRSLPRGVAASGTFMLLGFNTTATALIDPGRQFLVQADFSMGPNFGELLSFRGGSLIVNITGPGGFTPPEHVYVALEGTLRVLYTDVSAAMVIDDTSMRAEFMITNLFTVPGLGASVVATATTAATSWTLQGAGDALMNADFILRGELTLPPLNLGAALAAFRDAAGPLIDIASDIVSWVEARLREMWQGGADLVQQARNGVQRLGFNIPDTGDIGEVDEVDARVRSLRSDFEAAMNTLADIIDGLQITASFEVGTGASLGSYLTATIVATRRDGTATSFEGRIETELSAQDIGVMVWNLIVDNYVPVARTIRAAITEAEGHFNELRARLEAAADRGFTYTRNCDLIPDTRSMPCDDTFLGACIGWENCPSGFARNPFTIIYVGECIESPYDPCDDAAPGYSCALQVCVIEL